jgi:microcystin-dependent protein
MSIVDGTIFLSDGGGSVVLPVIGPPGAAANDLMTFDGTNWIARDALIQNRGGGQSHNNMQPYLGINHVIALVGVYPSRSAVEPFIAEIMMFAGNFAPRGWALCDGQLLSVSSNAALFSLLGTTYGGDGRTTFALPDLRGRTAIHPGSGPGLSTRRLGERGGSETTTLSISQMPAHNHTITYQ